MSLRITSGMDWTFEMIDDVFHKIEHIAKTKYKTNTYPNQLEIITSEQMLDAYASHGLPVYYPHWSFGEHFIQQLEYYKRGYMGLAYEIVINSNPCISYLMEENTMGMQTLVIAHAAFGHNHFFKNNYLFKQWTDAEAIIDYLVFAKRFIKECEEKHGIGEVEKILDVAHSLQFYGIDKYKRPQKLSAAEEEKLRDEREKYIQSQLNEVWKTIPKTKDAATAPTHADKFPKEPEENILYFIEKNAPRLEDWQREILRIVRKTSQYFYPQMQTKIMNEGFATFIHYNIMYDLYDQEVLDDGAMQEFLASHTGVVRQLDFDHKHFSGMNPYAIGFAMYNDIKRVATEPTQEDRDWFGKQEWVGCGDWLSTIHWAVQNFKDESFIRQFLSPKLIRDLKLFVVHDDERDPMIEISAIHNEKGYRQVRNSFATQNDIFGHLVPNIQVVDVDRWGDRTLTLRHYMVNRKPLIPEVAAQTLKYVSALWGYPVKLESVDVDGEVRMAWKESNDQSILDVFLDDDK